jgi:hypothetical protein
VSERSFLTGRLLRDVEWRVEGLRVVDLGLFICKTF